MAPGGERPRSGGSRQAWDPRRSAGRARPFRDPAPMGASSGAPRPTRRVGLPPPRVRPGHPASGAPPPFAHGRRPPPPNHRLARASTEFRPVAPTAALGARLGGGVAARTGSASPRRPGAPSPPRLRRAGAFPGAAHEPTRRPVHPRRVGPRRAARGQRAAARAHADDGPPRGEMPARDARHPWDRRRPARGADGQLRGRTHDDRRGARRPDGPAAHRPGPCATAPSPGARRCGASSGG